MGTQASTASTRPVLAGTPTRAAGHDGSAHRALRDCDAVGAGVVVRGRPHVENLGRMTVGDEAHIDASPIPTHLVTGPQGELTIGARVHIGHGSGVVAHARVRIGDGASLGAFVMVMDTDFHVAGSREAAPTPTPIEIGPGARIGNNVTVLRGSTIGAGARVAPGSVVSGVVPPFTEVAGVPARPVAVAATAGDAASNAADRVFAVVQSVFGAAEPLELARRLDTLPTWDSLTSLNLLLSLEGAFGVELTPGDVSAARTIADVVRAVEGRRA